MNGDFEQKKKMKERKFVCRALPLNNCRSK